MMNASKKLLLIKDSLRFLLAGCLNTLMSLALYQLLLSVIAPTLAYGITWALGIMILLVFYPKKVFPDSNPAAVDYIFITFFYVLVFVVGLCSLSGLSSLNINPRLSIFIVLVITTLCNFSLMRFVLR